MSAAGMPPGVPPTLPSASPAPFSAPAVSAEVPWIKVTLQLVAGSPPVPGEVPTGITVGSLLADFLEEQGAATSEAGNGAQPPLLSSGPPPPLGLAPAAGSSMASGARAPVRRRLVAAVLNGECISTNCVLAPCHQGAVIAPLFAGDGGEGSAVVARSVALLASAAARLEFGPDMQVVAARLCRQSQASLVLELLADASPLSANTADASAWRGGSDTGWRGDHPSVHPSVSGSGPCKPVRGHSPELANRLERRMRNLVHERRPFTVSSVGLPMALAQLQAGSSAALPASSAEATTSGSDVSASAAASKHPTNAGLRLLQANHPPSLTLTTIGDKESTSGSSSQSASLGWCGEPNFGVTVASCFDLEPGVDFRCLPCSATSHGSGSSHHHDAQPPGQVAIALYPSGGGGFGGGLSSGGGLGGGGSGPDDAAPGRCPASVWAALTEAAAEQASAHGLDCAAAVNGRVARAPWSQAKATCALAEALAAAKLRRLADKLVGASAQVSCKNHRSRTLGRKVDKKHVIAGLDAVAS